MAAPNGSHVDWADQVPIAAAPLNSVPYTGPPLDPSQETEVDLTLKNQPAMVYLPQPTSAKVLNDVLSVAKNGFAASGSAASGIGPLIGSFDIFESDDGFLFRVALPGVVKNEQFKCDIQTDGTITINGVTNTGEKRVNAHNMVFEMHTQNLCPPGDFSVTFVLPAHVDPSTLEHVLDNGVLEGVVKKKAA
ncbi:putative alpha crystallin/Hsp20 domain, HSP20-like chaperone, increased DNA methylation [Helianthus debilis subsp. tardiflorus]